jgi:hypothetical protein
MSGSSTWLFVLPIDTVRTQIHGCVYHPSLLSGSASKCPAHSLLIWLRDGKLRGKTEDGHASEDLISLLSQVEEEASKAYRGSVSPWLVLRVWHFIAKCDFCRRYGANPDDPTNSPQATPHLLGLFQQL